MKKLWAEFKKFISRGNIMDLAVGVIVGGAFTAIVTALTNNILRPIVNVLIA
ncbi:MAG: MscL family protein, partial [Clostridia bacterium]|nr:MscL family protein [Clostridia bacterium]